MIRSVLLVTQYYPPERGAAQVRLGAIVRELRRRDLDEKPQREHDRQRMHAPERLG